MKRVTLRQRALYVVGRIAMGVLNALPERLAYGIAGTAGSLFFRCSRRRQRLAMRMLRNAFPAGRTDRELLRLGRLGTANLFKVAIDVMRLDPWLRRGRLWERVDLGGLAELPQPPFVGVTAHLGAWEVGAVATALTRGESHVIARAFRNPLVQRFVLSSRRRNGLVIHPKRGGMRAVARALEQGLVGLQVADQRQRQRGVSVPFFGELASTDRSAATLALRFGCPIAVAGMVRVGPGFRFRGLYGRTLYPEPTGDREVDIERMTAEVNRGLEQLILRHPEQYLWIHDRYRKSSQQSDEPAA